jgi:hypothetical protein
MLSERIVFVCAWMAGGVMVASGTGAAVIATTPQPKTIALTGTDGVYGPNTGAGGMFYQLLGAEMNGAGQLAFGAHNGTTGGVWNGVGLSRGPIAVLGMPVAGVANGTYSTVNYYGVRLNEAGQTLFDARIVGASDPLANAQSFLASDGGSVVVYGRYSPSGSGGGPLPSDPLRYVSLQQILSNGQHSIAYYGDRALGPELWVGDPGNVRSAARRGAAAPGTPTGVHYAQLGLYTVDLNRSRTLLYHANLETSTGANAGSAMYVANDTVSTLVAKSTDPAPGLPAGTTFGSFGGYGAISDDGQVAVLSNVGLHIGAPGALRLSARAGMAAPGEAAGTTFLDVQKPQQAGSGKFLFNANLTGPSGVKYTVWLDEGSGPRKIFEDGQTAPSLPPGVVMHTVFPNAANSLGQFILDSTLSGPGVSSTNDQFEAVWDPTAGILPIGRAGDSMLLGTGQTKTIRSLSDLSIFTLNTGGMLPGTNEVWTGAPVGVVTYLADFTDGTEGSFALVVPSPGIASFGLVLMTMGARRTRRGISV